MIEVDLPDGEIMSAAGMDVPDVRHFLLFQRFVEASTDPHEPVFIAT